MKRLIEGMRGLRPLDIVAALGRNRQFVALCAVLLLAVAFFPGKPAAPLLSGLGGNDTQPPGTFTAPQPSGGSATNGRGVGADVGGRNQAGVPPVTGGGDFAAPPPATPPPARPPCSTDAVADIVDQIREPLGAALGAPAPGESIRDLAAIAAGCSSDDPSGPVLSLVLDLAALVPDLGLPPVDLPDLPALPPVDAPPGVVEALGPIAEEIRSGCGTLSLLAVVLAVLPPASNLPFSGSDLAQLAAPISVFCGLFDEGRS